MHRYPQRVTTRKKRELKILTKGFPRTPMSVGDGKVVADWVCAKENKKEKGKREKTKEKISSFFGSTRIHKASNPKTKLNIEKEYRAPSSKKCKLNLYHWGWMIPIEFMTMEEQKNILLHLLTTLYLNCQIDNYWSIITITAPFVIKQC
jgi:hypothetical protein